MMGESRKDQGSIGSMKKRGNATYMRACIVR